MFEVIAFYATKSASEYKGDNWVEALTHYGRVSQYGTHVVLWDGEYPVREYHPLLGHTSSGTHDAAVASL